MNIKNEYAKQYRNRVLNRMTTLLEYVPGPEKWPDGRVKTWCNIAARDVLDSQYEGTCERGGYISAYNYDLSIVFPQKAIRNIIMNTPIATYEKEILKAVKDGIIIELDEWTIQDAYEQGEIIHLISAQKNHEALVSSTLFVPSRGLFIECAQCGLYCGIYDVTDPKSFGAVKLGFNIHAIVYPKIGGYK